MAAPVGNKNSVGHGRPANSGYEDEDLIILGEEFVAWMKQMDDDPSSNTVHLSEWWAQIKNISKSQWESIIKRSCFKCYYDKAMKWMGVKLLKNKNLHPSYGNRFLTIYMKEVKEEEEDIREREYEKKRKLIEYEMKLKSENDQNISANTLNQFTSLMSQISLLQSTSKIDCNSINEEQKS